MKLGTVNIIVAFALRQVFAAAAPETCDPADLKVCMDRFESRFAQCGEDDTYCQCMSVLRDGGSCYAACPQEAMTTFIKTYRDGMCGTFDPHMVTRSVQVYPDHEAQINQAHRDSHRDSNKSYINKGDVVDDNDLNAAGSHILETRGSRGDQAEESTVHQPNATDSPYKKTLLSPEQPAASTYESITRTPESAKEPADGFNASGQVKVLTVTAAEPTSTTSLSPQAYQSRMEKERYKENLRSIRSERKAQSERDERERSEAKARAAAATEMKQDYVKQASDSVSSTDATATATTTTSAHTSHKHNHEKDKKKKKKQKSKGLRVVPTLSLFLIAVAIAVAM